jgi:hypothetical protein
MEHWLKDQEEYMLKKARVLSRRPCDLVPEEVKEFGSFPSTSEFSSASLPLFLSPSLKPSPLPPLTRYSLVIVIAVVLVVVEVVVEIVLLSLTISLILSSLFQQQQHHHHHHLLCETTTSKAKGESVRSCASLRFDQSATHNVVIHAVLLAGGH